VNGPDSAPGVGVVQGGPHLRVAGGHLLGEHGAIPVTYGPGLAERLGALDVERVDLALDVAGAGSLAELVAITGTAASTLTIADFAGPQVGVRLSLGDSAVSRTGGTVCRSRPRSRRRGVSVFRCGRSSHEPGSSGARGRGARTPAGEDRARRSLRHDRVNNATIRTCVRTLAYTWGMRRGVHFQTVPRRVEVMEHTGQESLSRMEEWVVDLRLRGLVGPRFEFSTLVDDGRPVGRLRVGPGAEALITEGGRLVFQPNPRGGAGDLEVVAEDRFFREFQPLR
jgi:hypothetical protein